MMGKRRIASLFYFKIDGNQLSVNGNLEVPMNTVIREELVGIDGSVHYEEMHKAPYIKTEFKVEKIFLPQN